MTLASSAALAQPASTGPLTPPQVPDGLEIPAGNTLFLKGHAHGTQNYVCLPSATGFAWTFFSPQATLFFNFKLGNFDINQQIITHFLSPDADPADKGNARVTWQSSVDSSAVWAKAIQPSSDPKFVAVGAIPWVKLGEVGTQAGPTGGTTLSHTTFIQRVNTAGGVAPPTGCSVSTDVGATALVPYTADYFFYKASNQKDADRKD